MVPRSPSITDCIALKSVLTAKWTHRQLVRSQAAIQSYSGRATIAHRAGELAHNVDFPFRERALPNDTSNTAADLDPNSEIEIGGMTCTANAKHSPFL